MTATNMRYNFVGFRYSQVYSCVNPVVKGLMNQGEFLLHNYVINIS